MAIGPRSPLISPLAVGFVGPPPAATPAQAVAAVFFGAATIGLVSVRDTFRTIPGAVAVREPHLDNRALCEIMYGRRMSDGRRTYPERQFDLGFRQRLFDQVRRAAVCTSDDAAAAEGPTNRDIFRAASLGFAERLAVYYAHLTEAERRLVRRAIDSTLRTDDGRLREDVVAREPGRYYLGVAKLIAAFLLEPKPAPDRDLPQYVRRQGLSAEAMAILQGAITALQTVFPFHERESRPALDHLLAFRGEFGIRGATLPEVADYLWRLAAPRFPRTVDDVLRESSPAILAEITGVELPQPTGDLEHDRALRTGRWIARRLDAMWNYIVNGGDKTAEFGVKQLEADGPFDTLVYRLTTRPLLWPTREWLEEGLRGATVSEPSWGVPREPAESASEHMGRTYGFLAELAKTVRRFPEFRYELQAWGEIQRTRQRPRFEPTDFGRAMADELRDSDHATRHLVAPASVDALLEFLRQLLQEMLQVAQGI